MAVTTQKDIEEIMEKWWKLKDDEVQLQKKDPSLDEGYMQKEDVNKMLQEQGIMSAKDINLKIGESIENAGKKWQEQVTLINKRIEEVTRQMMQKVEAVAGKEQENKEGKVKERWGAYNESIIQCTPVLQR